MPENSNINLILGAEMSSAIAPGDEPPHYVCGPTTGCGASVPMIAAENTWPPCWRTPDACPECGTSILPVTYFRRPASAPNAAAGTTGNESLGTLVTAYGDACYALGTFDGERKGTETAARAAYLTAKARLVAGLRDLAGVNGARDEPQLPTLEDQLHTHRNRLKMYDAVKEAWEAGGKVGPLPPRPVAPHIPGFNPRADEEKGS